MKGITFSLISGLLAATASLCGKFSMAAEEALYLCEKVLYLISKNHSTENLFTYSPVCQNVLVFTRVGFFMAMLLSNALMWTMFTKALRLCSTTLEATVTNTATNFFFTAYCKFHIIVIAKVLASDIGWLLGFMVQGPGLTKEHQVHNMSRYNQQAIYGQVFFGESLSPIWWLGTMMIIFGLLLMHRETQMESTGELREHKRK